MGYSVSHQIYEDNDMGILNEEATAVVGGGLSTMQVVPVEQKSTISRRMHAELKLNAHLMAKSRDNLAVELARTPNLDPQEMLNRITEIQHVTNKVEELSASYADAPQTPLTSSDVEAMKNMSNMYGQSVTAKCFSLKQPAVSDLINGKTKV